MRTIAVIVLLVVATPFTTPAQGFKAGLIAGGVVSQVDGDGYGGYNKAGPLAGIWVQRGLSNNLDARLELRYIQKGSYAKDRELGSTIFRLRLNYFEVNMGAGYRIKERFRATLGLGVGYLASAQQYDAAGIIPEPQAARFRKFELSGFLGVGYRLSPQWQVEGRFSYSLIPLSRNLPSIQHWRNYGPYNKVLELGIVYEF